MLIDAGHAFCLKQLVLEEADRSLHDALCVVRCLVQQPYLIAGGGAPEIEMSRQLQDWSKTLTVRTLREASISCSS